MITCKNDKCESHADNEKDAWLQGWVFDGADWWCPACVDAVFVYARN